MALALAGTASTASMPVDPFATGERLFLREIPKPAGLGPRLAVPVILDSARSSSGSAAGQAAFARLIKGVAATMFCQVLRKKIPLCLYAAVAGMVRCLRGFDSTLPQMQVCDSLVFLVLTSSTLPPAFQALQVLPDYG